jgi:hypothetical protein
MIIAHNNDYKEFYKLLLTTVSKLAKDSQQRMEYYLGRGGTALEKDVFKILNKQAQNTIFQNNIELISGQKFPDIVAYVNKNKAYGIEVKTTKANKWKSTGSSIFEGTRVDDVKNIHLLFGKLVDPVEFKCRRYEECLYDVAITHSPRYLIDMDTTFENSIFSKVGVGYETLRKLPNPFKPIKKYFREHLKKGEDIWWIDTTEDSVRDLRVKLWANLPPTQKDDLRIMALARFPNLLRKDAKKYARLATWLVSQFGIVNHALRDTFSAGGQIDIKNTKFPKIYKHLTNDLNKIYANIESIDEDDLKHYWDIEKIKPSKTDHWKKLCLLHCKNDLSKNQYKIIKRILEVN